MPKIFIINDTSVTGGVDDTSDIGSSSIKWKNGYILRTLTVGTVSATGAVIGVGGSISGTVTLGTVSATGNGIFGGALSFSTAATMIGERAYITFNFDSNASTKYQALPFNSNVIDCWTTCDTTPRSVSAFTLRAGSAGTVYVASVATLVFATAAGQQHQPTLTPAAITTASALNVTVGTSGSAGNFSATVVIQRTA